MQKRIPSNLTLTFDEISEARICCLKQDQGSFLSDLHLLQREKAVANSSTFRTLSAKLATDLSTETFLAELPRFISRRGKCTHIFSDNGRHFVCMYKLILSQQHNTQVTQALASEGIKWSFIPSHAPHWGGKWESAVHSVKLHLRRVIGNSILTFEQMHTLLAQIESVVNLRPLFATSDIVVFYLSPAHALVGRPYTSVPEVYIQ